LQPPLRKAKITIFAAFTKEGKNHCFRTMDLTPWQFCRSFPL